MFLNNSASGTQFGINLPHTAGGGGGGGGNALHAQINSSSLPRGSYSYQTLEGKKSVPCLDLTKIHLDEPICITFFMQSIG